MKIKRYALNQKTRSLSAREDGGWVKYSVVKEIERERQMLELDVQRLTWLILHGQRKLGALWKEMSDEEIDQEMRGE